MAAVVLENLSKAFREAKGQEIWAVREISLTVKEGELLVLVGPSGSGKTTMLRLIAGLETPTSGRIWIGAKVVNDLPAHDREVAMVFQEHSLYPHLSVRENLGFGLRLRKRARSEMETRVTEMAQLLGVSAHLDRMPEVLSGGERQRVALGRALVLDLAVVLLDEPLSNLDGPLRAQLRRELRGLHRRFGRTMIYVTHDQSEAMALADRVAVVHQGFLQQIGTPLELYEQPGNLFVAKFIGVPPMNLFPGRIELISGGLWFIGAESSLRLDLSGLVLPQSFRPENASMILGLRPEQISVLDPGEPGRSPLLAFVEHVERLGWETHVALRSGAAQFVARAGADCPRQAGDQVRVGFNLARARWFDPGLGAALE
jgi:ABC-type sugar transport system ATPase subunit